MNTTPDNAQGLRALVRLFTNGYKSGHHDTVEGQFTDVYQSDLETYFEDQVREILTEPEYAALATHPPQQERAAPWRSMESAPRDGTIVFGMLPDSNVAHAVFYGDKHRKQDGFRVCWRVAWDGAHLSEHSEPIAWMPIPDLAAAPAAPATPDLSALIGMEVSVDVSTGDDDAERRYFGTVVGTNPGDGKHGSILLVADCEPNFEAVVVTPESAEPELGKRPTPQADAEIRAMMVAFDAAVPVFRGPCSYSGMLAARLKLLSIHPTPAASDGGLREALAAWESVAESLFGAADCEHVHARISCILSANGLIPGENEGESCAEPSGG